MECSIQSLGAASSLHPHHELRIGLGKNLDISIGVKGVEESASILPICMFHIPHMRIDHDLYPCSAIPVWLCVCYTSANIQHGANRYRLFESAWIKIEELNAAVGEGRCASERELESLLEQIASEDHKVVSIPVLWL